MHLSLARSFPGRTSKTSEYDGGRASTTVIYSGGTSLEPLELKSLLRRVSGLDSGWNTGSSGSWNNNAFQKSFINTVCIGNIRSRSYCCYWKITTSQQVWIYIERWLTFLGEKSSLTHQTIIPMATRTTTTVVISVWSDQNIVSDWKRMTSRYLT